MFYIRFFSERFFGSERLCCQRSSQSAFNIRLNVCPQALAVGGVGSIVRVLTARKTVWSWESHRVCQWSERRWEPRSWVQGPLSTGTQASSLSVSGHNSLLFFYWSWASSWCTFFLPPPPYFSAFTFFNHLLDLEVLVHRQGSAGTSACLCQPCIENRHISDAFTQNSPLTASTLHLPPPLSSLLLFSPPVIQVDEM